MPALRLVEGSAPASDQGPSSAFDVPVEADGQPTDEEALDAYSRPVSQAWSSSSRRRSPVREYGAARPRASAGGGAGSGIIFTQDGFS